MTTVKVTYKTAIIFVLSKQAIFFFWSMAKGSQRKSGRRNLHGGEEENELYKNYQQEIVEVERNLLEQWLLSGKHWAQKNITFVRYSIFSVFGLLLLFFVFLFVADMRLEKHSNALYSLVTRLESANENTPNKELLQESDKLCNTWWSTPASQNACLISAVLRGQAKEFSAMAENLKTYNRFWNKKMVLPVTLFYQGIAYEAQGDLDNAYQTFQQLEKSLEETQNADAAIFHRAHILYRQNKQESSAKLFRSLLEDYKESPYAEDAKKYLILIEARNAQEAMSQKSKG